MGKIKSSKMEKEEKKKNWKRRKVLFVDGVSQGRICSDNFTCCHTEIDVADPTFYLTQSQYTDTGR